MAGHGTGALHAAIELLFPEAIENTSRSRSQCGHRPGCRPAAAGAAASSLTAMPPEGSHERDQTRLGDLQPRGQLDPFAAGNHFIADRGSSGGNGHFSHDETDNGAGRNSAAAGKVAISKAAINWWPTVTRGSASDRRKVRTPRSTWATTSRPAKVNRRRAGAGLGRRTTSTLTRATAATGVASAMGREPGTAFGQANNGPRPTGWPSRHRQCIAVDEQAGQGSERLGQRWDEGSHLGLQQGGCSSTKPPAPGRWPDGR